MPSRNMFLDTGAIGIFQFKSSKVTILLLITSCCVFATTQGYDSALMNGINILPSYRQTLNLTTATYSLNTAASFVGWGIASMLMGPVVEKVGRKSGIVLSVILKLLGILFMTAAQNVAMFVIGRILLGTGTCTAAIASSSWLAETLPSEMRGMGLSITYSVYYVGSLLCAGVTYGTASMPGSWSWRLPCLLQSIFSLCCAAVLLFVPESPRWLVYQDRVDDALAVIAATHADCDRTNPVVLQLHKEIIDTLTWERSQGRKPTYQEMLKTPNSRRRLALCLSVAVISMLSGNNMITYYLGDMLEGAGITNKITKLRINIILSAFCLVCAMVGTFSMDRVGRKSMCLGACVFMTIMLFLVGALTKVFGSGGNNSGIYGTVAAIFLFQGSYSMGITPITTLYSSEILSYSIRSNGMAAWSMTVTAGGLFCTFVFPFALDAISWTLYMINGAWDVLQCIYVAFCWIETKGLTLEEIDGKLEGIKQHSNVLDLEDLKKDIIVQDLEVNINSKGTSSGQ